MNRVTLWVRLRALRPLDRACESRKGYLAPRTGPHFGTRPVRSQGQLGQAFKLCTPVVQLFLGRLRSQPGSLPLREISVLERKLGQFGGGPVFAGGIERLKLFPEQSL